MFEYFVYCYGMEFIGLMLCTIFGCLGYAAKMVYKSYIDKQNACMDTDMKISIARTAAQFVEQAWKTIHGPDKLEKALETAEILLRKKGIPFDADEMKVLIVAAVSEFNDAFNAAATPDPVTDTVVEGFCA